MRTERSGGAPQLLAMAAGMELRWRRLEHVSTMMQARKTALNVQPSSLHIGVGFGPSVRRGSDGM